MIAMGSNLCSVMTNATSKVLLYKELLLTSNQQETCFEAAKIVSENKVNFS
jgi:hypothetical protein